MSGSFSRLSDAELEQMMGGSGEGNLPAPAEAGTLRRTAGEAVNTFDAMFAGAGRALGEMAGDYLGWEGARNYLRERANAQEYEASRRPSTRYGWDRPIESALGAVANVAGGLPLYLTPAGQVTAGLSFVGENIEEQERRARAEAERNNQVFDPAAWRANLPAAIGTAVPQVLMERGFGPERFMRGAGHGVTRDVGGPMARFGVGAGRSAVAEGITEGAQEFLQISQGALSQQSDPVDAILSEDTAHRLGQAAMLGAIGGGVLGGGIGAFAPGATTHEQALARVEELGLPETALAAPLGALPAPGAPLPLPGAPQALPGATAAAPEGVPGVAPAQPAAVSPLDADVAGMQGQEAARLPPAAPDALWQAYASGKAIGNADDRHVLRTARNISKARGETFTPEGFAAFVSQYRAVPEGVPRANVVGAFAKAQQPAAGEPAWFQASTLPPGAPPTPAAIPEPLGATPSFAPGSVQTEPNTLPQIEGEKGAISPPSPAEPSVPAEPAQEQFNPYKGLDGKALKQAQKKREHAVASIQSYLADMASRGEQGAEAVREVSKVIGDGIDNGTVTPDGARFALNVADAIAKQLPAGAGYRVKILDTLFRTGTDTPIQGRVTEALPDQNARGLIEFGLRPADMAFGTETIGHEGFHVIQNILSNADPAFKEKFDAMFPVGEDGFFHLADADKRIVRKLQSLKRPDGKTWFDFLNEQSYGSRTKGIMPPGVSENAQELQAVIYGALHAAKQKGGSMTGLPSAMDGMMRIGDAIRRLVKGRDALDFMQEVQRGEFKAKQDKAALAPKAASDDKEKEEPAPVQPEPNQVENESARLERKYGLTGSEFESFYRNRLAPGEKVTQELGFAGEKPHISASILETLPFRRGGISNGDYVHVVVDKEGNASIWDGGNLLRARLREQSKPGFPKPPIPVAVTWLNGSEKNKASLFHPRRAILSAENERMGRDAVRAQIQADVDALKAAGADIPSGTRVVSNSAGMIMEGAEVPEPVRDYDNITGAAMFLQDRTRRNLSIDASIEKEARGKLDEKTKNRIAAALALDFMGAVRRQTAADPENLGFDWYDRSIKRAVGVFSDRFPEFRDDVLAQNMGFGSGDEGAANARTMMLLTLAITSQGSDVNTQTPKAVDIYARLRERVAKGEPIRFDVTDGGTGKNSRAVAGNFEKFNRLMTDAPGISDQAKLSFVRKFLNSEVSTQDLAARYPGWLTQHVMHDPLVPGSAVFGPKIGGAFYQNLIGNFDPLTVDIWFVRSYNRHFGHLIGNQKRLARQIANMRSAYDEGVKNRRMKPEIAAEREEIMRAEIAAEMKQVTANRKVLWDASATADAKAAAQEATIESWERINALNYAIAALTIHPPAGLNFNSRMGFAEAGAYARRIEQAWLNHFKAERGPWMQERLAKKGYSEEDAKLLANTTKPGKLTDKQRNDRATLLNEYASEHQPGGTMADRKPMWAVAAKALKAGQADPFGIPQSREDRQNMKAVTEEAVALLNKAAGKTAGQPGAVTPASFQAVLWYLEKELWGRVYGRNAMIEHTAEEAVAGDAVDRMQGINVNLPVGAMKNLDIGNKNYETAARETLNPKEGTDPEVWAENEARLDVAAAGAEGSTLQREALSDEDAIGFLHVDPSINPRPESNFSNRNDDSDIDADANAESARITDRYFDMAAQQQAADEGPVQTEPDPANTSFEVSPDTVTEMESARLAPEIEDVLNRVVHQPKAAGYMGRAIVNQVWRNPHRAGILKSLRSKFVDRYSSIEDDEKMLKGGDRPGGQIGQRLSAEFSGYTALWQADDVDGFVENMFHENGSLELVQDPKNPRKSHWQIKANDANAGMGWFNNYVKDSGDGDTMKARMKAFQAYALIKRGLRLNAQGIGVPIQASDRATLGVIVRDFPGVVAAYDGYQRFNRNLMQQVVKAGVITQAEANEFMKHNDYYPYYRVVEDATGRVISKIAGVGGKFTPKEIIGGLEKFEDNPLVAIRSNIAYWTHAAMRNVAKQKIVATGLRTGSIEAREPKAGEGKINVLVAGKNYVFTSTDPTMTAAMEAYYAMPEEWRWISKFFGGPARVLRELVTKSPTFMLYNNMVRDSLSGWHLSGGQFVPIVDTYRNAMSAYQKDPATKKYLSLGHGSAMRHEDTMFRDIGDLLERDVRVQHGIYRASTPGKLLSFVEMAYEKLNRVGDASDLATRMAIFKQRLAAGDSEVEAAWRAREIMNFNKRGSNTALKLVSTLIPFLNSRIQGFDTTYQSIKGMFGGDARVGDPNMTKSQKAARFAFTAGLLFALALTIEMAWGDDDEVKDQPKYLRDSHLLVPMSALGFEGFGVLAIPKPFEFGTMFMTVPQQAYRALMGHETVANTLREIPSSVWASLSFTPAPAAALPIAEAWANYNFFTGKPITGRSMENLSPELRFTPQTPAALTALGRNMAAAFRSMGMEPPALFASPVLMNHLIRGYFGSAGISAVGALGMAAGVESVQEPSWRDIPVLNGMFRDPRASQPAGVDSLYRLLERSDEVAQTLRHYRRVGDIETVRDIESNNADLIRARSSLTQMKSRQDRLVAEQRRIIRNPNIPIEERRRRLEQVSDQVREHARGIERFRLGLGL